MSGVHRSGQPGEPDYRLAVYPSPLRLSLLIAGALAFVLVGAFLCVRATGGDENVAMLFIGIVTVVFFGACLLYGMLRLIVRKPAVVLDNTGLYDHASAVSAGFLPWNEISATMAVEFGRQRMLSVSVTDPEALLSRMSGLKRYAMRANIKLNGTAVNIPQNMLPIKVAELEAEIDRVVHHGIDT